MMRKKKRIPNKFSKVDKSFVNRLLLEESHGPLSSYSIFPKKVDFYGKDPGEEIVLIARTHWIYFVPNIFLTILILIVPFFFLALSDQIELLGSKTIYIGMVIAGMVLALNVAITTILKWYYTVNIVTDQRIVVIRMENAFYHSYAEAQLEKIEDVTHTNIGIIGNFFDAGDVHIDTAGHGVDFHLKMLPRPRELQDVINDLLEIKQKGDI
ncbi:MAG: hypothetical protein UR47_C0002G0076 [candidate division WS6 bacterium GW2011_GWB1_33_6]|uniref:DUF304 domain-containing protein n=2 Tax=Candidatus Dojkabacteria TaxID=74243 RepID=A0A0G0AF07_9BACT|nr:MAG: hypothetical protein UR47_C0002G0076 [candidate division WS6 bacterium GW2011_GWB1_33_6]HBB64697.1 hypothetical protein [Patescibacteria group bacterium]